jgi:dTDP-4-dehydrorhamnose 3,5-epimerase
MDIRELEIKNVYQIKNKLYEDKRGYFSEIYRKNDYEFLKTNFVQENYSFSNKYTLRGMHYQIKKPQAKLIRCLNGQIIDVILDLRKNSETYLKALSIKLDKNYTLYIPKGIAHGFLTLKDETILYYKTDEYFNSNDEDGFIWKDPKIFEYWNLKEFNIKEEQLILSHKDKHWGYLR